ncbi:AbrB family transcriptional regulator [Desulfovibrio sp.]
MTTFLLLIACGIVGGLLFFFLHIPGGAMLGAVVAVLAVKMLGHVETDTPHLFQLGAQIAIGVMVGNMMTGGTLLEIRAMAPLMFGSTALLVVAGALRAWFICRSAGLDAGSAILATSPGGLQAVVGMASDLGTNAPAVLAFHLVRLYTVLLLAPFLGWLLHRLLPHS